MEDKIVLVGTFRFDAENLTKKHVKQSEWKRFAMLEFDGDICKYYAWFINKRFNIKLNSPIRKAHVTFVNDSNNDLGLSSGKTIEQIDKRWQEVKEKYDGKQQHIMLDLKARISDKHWWFRLYKGYNQILSEIRSELGLGKPYFDYHLTLGFPYKKYEEHNKYIHELIKTKLIK